MASLQQAPFSIELGENDAMYDVKIFFNAENASFAGMVLSPSFTFLQKVPPCFPSSNPLPPFKALRKRERRGVGLRFHFVEWPNGVDYTYLLICCGKCCFFLT